VVTRGAEGTVVELLNQDVEVVVCGMRDDEVVIGEYGRVVLVVTGATKASVEHALDSKNRNMTMSLQKVFREPEWFLDSVRRSGQVIMAESLCGWVRSAAPRNFHLTFMFRE
jgi:hypothetical protein